MDKFFEFQNHIDKIYNHSPQVDDYLFDLFRCTSFYLNPHLIDSFFGQKVAAKGIDLKYLRFFLVKLRITLVRLQNVSHILNKCFTMKEEKLNRPLLIFYNANNLFFVLGMSLLC